MLWVSWLFFNGGSTFDIYAPRGKGTPKIMMNTILAGAGSGLISQSLKSRINSDKHFYDVSGLCNGLLTGLVSVTGCCNDVMPEMAFFIGAVGGVIYVVGTWIMGKLKVDDPVDASVVHGMGGIWGLLAGGLFNKSTGLLMAKH